MDRKDFEALHQDILDTISRDYNRGYELYQQNLSKYDSLPTDQGDLRNNRLTKKLEVCAAMEKATGVLGVGICVADGAKVNTLDSVDTVIRLIVNGINIVERKDLFSFPYEDFD